MVDCVSRYFEVDAEIYAAMASEAFTEPDGGTVWQGSFDGLLRETCGTGQFNGAVRRRILSDLTLMGCIRQVSATSGEGSRYELLREPTLDLFVAHTSHRLGPGRPPRKSFERAHAENTERFFAMVEDRNPGVPRETVLDFLAAKSEEELRAMELVPCLALLDARFSHTCLEVESRRQEQQRQEFISTGGKT